MQWNPWIGRNYNQCNPKILIVGESNYFNAQTSKAIVEGDKDWTCGNITNVINGMDSIKAFNGFHKSLGIEDLNMIQNFWDRVAFHNLVQRALDATKNEQPNRKDILKRN